MSTNYHTQYTQRYGGNGGGEFSDTFDQLGQRGKIVQIFVRHGTLVDNITTVFADGTSIGHGGNGGSSTTITLDDDEYVTGIKLRSGTLLDQINFITNKRTFGPFGGNGGSETTISFGGKALQYLFGRSGSLVDAIGFAYGDMLPAKATRITKSAAQGGNGGSPWDDLDALKHVLLRVKKIRVRSGSLVDRLEFTYTTGHDDQTFAHGGTGGNYGPDFVLNDDEYITQVVGRSGTEIDAVQFVLNSGRRSALYGGGGGSPFTISAPSGSCVCAFYGRSGSRTDALGAYFSSRIPVKVSFYDLQFHGQNFTYQAIKNGTFTSVTLHNGTSIQQTLSESRTFSYQVTSTSSFQTSFSTTMEYTFEAGFEFEGIGAKETVKMGYTAGFTTTTEKAVTTSESDSYNFTVTVPPHTTVEGTLMGTYYKYSVPWTGKARVYFNTGDYQEQTIDGVLQDVNAAEFTATYKELTK